MTLSQTQAFHMYDTDSYKKLVLWKILCLLEPMTTIALPMCSIDKKCICELRTSISQSKNTNAFSPSLHNKHKCKAGDLCMFYGYISSLLDFMHIRSN